MRIVQISDTHISHLGGVPSRNMELVAEYLNHHLRPDLVVNTGDIVILDADSAEDRHTAWRLHQDIGGHLRVVPGNHDVGEPGDAPWMGMSVTSERVANFKDTWGSDRFVEFGEPDNGAEGWVFIGINSQVLSSRLPEEADQWHWLEEVVGKVQGLSVLLFLHKPMSLSGRADRDITIAASGPGTPKEHLSAYSLARSSQRARSPLSAAEGGRASFCLVPILDFRTVC